MRGIRKAFGAHRRRRRRRSRVAPGEVCALVGENGAGKSTLMAILRARCRPTPATMTLDGQPYGRASPLEPARRRRDDLPGAVARAAPVGDGEHPRSASSRRDSASCRTRATCARSRRDALHELGHADIAPDAAVGTLVVAAAAARRDRARARRRLPRARPRRADQQPWPRRRRASLRADRALQGPGPRHRLHLALPRRSHAQSPIESSCCATAESRAAERRGDLTAADIVRLMVGRRVDDLYPRSPRHVGEADSATSRPLTAGSHATFTLHRGEIIGIAGLVGAGRTRLLRGIFGLEAVRSGACVGACPAAPRGAGAAAWACSARTAKAKGSRSA